MSLFAPGIGVVSGSDPVTVDVLKFTGSLVSLTHSDNMMVVDVSLPGYLAADGGINNLPTFDTDDGFILAIDKIPWLSGTALTSSYTGNPPFYDTLSWFVIDPYMSKQFLRKDEITLRNSAMLPVSETFTYFWPYSFNLGGPDLYDSFPYFQFDDAISYNNNVFEYQRIRRGRYLPVPSNFLPVSMSMFRVTTNTSAPALSSSDIVGGYNAVGSFTLARKAPVSGVDVLIVAGNYPWAQVNNSQSYTIHMSAGQQSYFNIPIQTTALPSYADPTVHTCTFYAQVNETVLSATLYTRSNALIKDSPNTLSHVYFSSSNIYDTKGNIWNTVTSSTAFTASFYTTGTYPETGMWQGRTSFVAPTDNTTTINKYNYYKAASTATMQINPPWTIAAVIRFPDPEHGWPGWEKSLLTTRDAAQQYGFWFGEVFQSYNEYANSHFPGSGSGGAGVSWGAETGVPGTTTNPVAGKYYLMMVGISGSVTSSIHIRAVSSGTYHETAQAGAFWSGPSQVAAMIGQHYGIESNSPFNQVAWNQYRELVAGNDMVAEPTGSIVEIWFSSDAPTSATFDAITNQVRSRLKLGSLA